MSSRHPRAPEIIRTGVFDGIESFEMLEGRIAQASTNEKDKGDIFEVFAEAYLKTVWAPRFEEVWPASIIPMSLRERYLLPYPEKGADGLVRLTNGEYHTYQVKFRTGRSPLTWSEHP